MSDYYDVEAYEQQLLERIKRLVSENERLTKELEEVKFALQVEEHDNEYNCAERDKLRTENSRLREASQAVIDRWDTPLWKDVPHTAEYIEALRRVLAPQIEEK